MRLRSGGGIQVRRVTSRWDPTTVTWAAQPTNTTENAVTNRSSVGGSCGPTAMSWDITSMARQWAGDGGNYGVVLMSPAERASANYRVFPSSENTDFNDPPKLTATFAPGGEATTLYPAGADGVEVIQAPATWGDDIPQLAEPQAHALSSAIDRAEANGDALAKPYVDMVSGQVIVPAASADGHTIGSAPLTGTAYLGLGGVDWTIPGDFTDGDTDEDSDGVVDPGESYTFTPQVPDAATSYSRQTAIAREIMNLTSAELPGADHLVEARIWAERNQVLIKTNAVSSELRLALAQRYGTNAVVLHLDPNATVLKLTAGTDSRANDNDGYINGGGAYVTEYGDECTMGFAWKIPAGKRLVTAGHCMPKAYSSVRVSNDGTRFYGQRVGMLTTYEYGKGTVPLPGQNKWLGDTALVTTDPSVAVPTASIFTGDETSRTRRPVKSSWSRRSAHNELYCVGGRSTGQHCNWRVDNPNTWKKTDGGTTDNIVTGKRSGDCVEGGDSGGPVYTFRSDGSVVAKGVANAGTSPLIGDCVMVFTDITTIREAYGGDVLKRK
ncbi:DNRLRE domain-containing protein [Nonomuraea coxensis]|nr:DNRLRE domain-containing protein [Nonomuraea coxensis]